LRLLPV